MSSVITIPITVLMVLFMATIVVSFIVALISKLKTKSEIESDNFDDKDDMTSLSTEAIISEKKDELSQDEIIAVLTAAVYASKAINPDVKIHVRSFRRVAQGAPVWNYYGRKEQILRNHI